MTQTNPETAGKTIKDKKEMAPQNKRRKALGIEVHNLDRDPDCFFSSSDSRYIRGLTTQSDFDMSRLFVGSGHFERSDRMNLLRRAKLYLFRRSFVDLSEDSRPKLYGAKNKIETVLDCFPSLKYSYSSSLPPKVVMRNHGIPEDFYGRFKPNGVRYFDVCCAPDGSSKKARMSDVSRSASVRLDPMDAPRQLFIYRCRIRRCLTWGYSVGLVPIMMTLTIFHRWHPLKKLLNVLSQSWDRFFASGRPAVTRTKRMGVQAYIRRLEETITDGSDSGDYNSGWHPHYHVILFVPADKVSVISDMEDELQSEWFDIVNHFFEKEFGESIDSSYAKSFKKHGLVFSRYRDTDDGLLINTSTYWKQSLTKSRKGCRKRPIRLVDDSDYMAKTFGCDSRMCYSGDTELTAIHAKNSRIPFDLLRDDTSSNNDLWVEYALATKGIRSFVFSRGLGGRVRDYFEAHPDKDTIKSFVKSDKVIAQIDSDAYGLLYRMCKVDDMLRVAVKGYDALCDWFKDFYQLIGFTAEEIEDDMMPLPPNTCLPFGDRIDVLTFSQRSKIKLNVKASSELVIDGEVSRAENSNIKRPRDAKIFNKPTMPIATSTSTQPSIESSSSSTSASSFTSSGEFASAVSSKKFSHPIQLELQFYSPLPPTSTERSASSKRTVKVESARLTSSLFDAPRSKTVVDEQTEKSSAQSTTDPAGSFSIKPTMPSMPAEAEDLLSTDACDVVSTVPTDASVPDSEEPLPSSPTERSASSKRTVKVESARLMSSLSDAPRSKTVVDEQAERPQAQSTTDQSNMGDELYLSAALPSDIFTDADDVLDARSKFVRLVTHVLGTRLMLVRNNRHVSAEVLQRVASYIEEEFAKLDLDEDPNASKSKVVKTQETEYEEQWISSEGFDPMDDLMDNSIEARIRLVSNSKWYPAWYLQHLLDERKRLIREARVAKDAFDRVHCFDMSS